MLLSFFLLQAAQAIECIYDYNPDYNSVANTGLIGAICSNNLYRMIPAQVDGDTYAFHFTTANRWAFESFNFVSRSETMLFIWDCFCAGDAFEVYDNGQLLVGAYPSDQVPLECEIRSEYPLQCIFNAMAESAFAGAIAQLPAGEHNITIAITASPYNSGTGFLSFKSSCANGGNIIKSMGSHFQPGAALFQQQKGPQPMGIPCCFPSYSCQLAQVTNQCQKLV